MSVVAVVAEGVGEAHGEGERETEREGKRERERETETERETERQREPRGTSKSIENLARIYRFENELKVNRKSTGKSYCRKIAAKVVANKIACAAKPVSYNRIKSRMTVRLYY